MATRDYTTGAPVSVTVDDITGAISVVVYLGEISQGITDDLDPDRDDMRAPAIVDALIIERALDEGRVTTTYSKGA